MEKRKFDLRPIDGRKSFYGKAIVFDDTENHTAYLFSYGTIVATYNYNAMIFRRIWPGYSVTTMRHINAFRQYFGLHLLNKAQWSGLRPYEPQTGVLIP